MMSTTEETIDDALAATVFLERGTIAADPNEWEEALGLIRRVLRRQKLPVVEKPVPGPSDKTLVPEDHEELIHQIQNEGSQKQWLVTRTIPRCPR